MAPSSTTGPTATLRSKSSRATGFRKNSINCWAEERSRPMFFLPDSSIDELEDIFKRVEKGTGDAEKLCHEALQLHPYDQFALLELTKRGREADHRDEVGRLTWRIAEL